jgi:hypothetical protein
VLIYLYFFSCLYYKKMGGGLMQLVAYGAQDIYLTSNPQITFFKIVYRRHTNFSRETIEQTHTGTAGPGKQITVTISRNGDLVHKLYMEVTNASTAGMLTLPNNLGNAMIDFAEIEIGGQTIDKIYGHWMEVWARLTEENPTRSVGLISNNLIDQHVQNVDDVMNAKLDGGTISTHVEGDGADGKYDIMLIDATSSGSGMLRMANHVDHITKYQQLACAGGVCNHSSIFGNGAEGRSGSGTKAPVKFSVPFPFWFCKNAGNSLPLIALQYHEVKLKIQFATVTTGCPPFTGVGSLGTTAKVWAEYIYLDTPERRRFAQVSHEYLIEQLQRFESSITTAATGKGQGTLNLNFNHPVKELIFASDFEKTANDHPRSGYGNLLGWGDNDTKVTLKLNGHDRFSAERDFYHFSRTQIWEHHTGPGNLYDGMEGLLNGAIHSGSGAAQKGSIMYNHDNGSHTAAVRKDQIGVYSFALKPEEHQPSGTCNFSRIDSTRLTFKDVKSYTDGTTGTTIPLIVYAINYNVLRIMSGMGGLAYSN